MSSTMDRGPSYPMRSADDETGAYPGSEQGTGWLYFAATLLGLAGVMRIIDSIWAFRYDGALPDNLQDGVLGSNLDNYAWTWLAVGVVLIVASFLVVARSQFGRWVGVIAAAIGGLSAMAWMPYYPIWSMVYIGLAVAVIYGLVVYGGRTTDA
jgi:hypothetical protein